MSLPSLCSASPAARAGSIASLQAPRTPAAAYACEQRLLAAYARLLYAPSTDVEQLMRQVWGEDLTTVQMYGYACKQGRIDRLDDDIPDLIREMRPHEQPALVELLLSDTPDLVGAIRYVLSLERRLLQREAPRATPDDAGHARAAGLGRISSENYGHLHPGYLFRLPPAKPKPAVPVLRTARRRRAKRAFLKSQQLSLFA